MPFPEQKAKVGHSASNVTYKDLLKARRIAKRTRTYHACARCKSRKAKCTDYRPCKRCANTKYAISCSSSLEDSTATRGNQTSNQETVSLYVESRGSQGKIESAPLRPFWMNAPQISRSLSADLQPNEETPIVSNNLLDLSRGNSGTGSAFHTFLRDSFPQVDSSSPHQSILPSIYSTLSQNRWPLNPSAPYLASTAHMAQQPNATIHLEIAALAAAQSMLPRPSLIMNANQSALATILSSFALSISPSTALLTSPFSNFPAPSLSDSFGHLLPPLSRLP